MRYNHHQNTSYLVILNLSKFYYLKELIVWQVVTTAFPTANGRTLLLAYCCIPQGTCIRSSQLCDTIGAKKNSTIFYTIFNTDGHSHIQTADEVSQKGVNKHEQASASSIIPPNPVCWLTRPALFLQIPSAGSRVQHYSSKSRLLARASSIIPPNHVCWRA